MNLHSALRASLLILCLGLAACGKDDDEDLTAMIQTPSQPRVSAPPVLEKKPEPPKYVYPYSERRDPFAPLVGSGTGNSHGLANAQDLINLELRGILMDRKGKVALISSSDGESYILRSGKIYDRKNRIISGVSGIIKENSVVIITQNKTVKELPMKKSAQ